MFDKIVHSSAPITLVGGGEATEDDVLQAAKLAPRLVAVDGGAGLALRAGVQPEAVVGDFDSLLSGDRARMPDSSLFRIDDQDTTDFDKALARVGAPVVLAVGFLGARIDHQLGALSTLLQFPHQPCVLIGADELVFLAPPMLELDLEPGAVVSLFPMVPQSGRSQGLEWPIDGLRLVPGGRIGTSNRATGPIVLAFEEPGMLVIVPRLALACVTQALGSLSSRRQGLWPAPA